MLTPITTLCVRSPRVVFRWVRSRHYYFSKYSNFAHYYIEIKDVAEALRITAKAMQEQNVVIAEAAFEWNSCLVRADILVKRGD